MVDPVEQISTIADDVISDMEDLKRSCMSFDAGLRRFQQECGRSDDIVKDYWADKSITQKETKRQKGNISLQENAISKGFVHGRPIVRETNKAV